ncbi:MAG: hypothetical protein BA066_07030 [Candidatus Korarchaeota archaeon NZ13-K]|nr:MAG: hypothetical protein BA066_07030 [Candidatus Korarchaeota archaeon NZ13-K]
MLEEFLESGYEKLEASLFEISMYEMIEELLSEYESLDRYQKSLAQLLSKGTTAELKAIRSEISSLVERLSREEILYSYTMDPSVVSPILRNRYQPLITEIMKKIKEMKVRASNELEAFINTILEVVGYCEDTTASLSFLSGQLRSMLGRMELVPPELLISTLELVVKHVPQEGAPERVFKEIRDLRAALAELSSDLSEENKERMRHALDTLNNVEVVVRRFPGLSGASLKYLEEFKGRLLDEMMRGLSRDLS